MPGYPNIPFRSPHDSGTPFEVITAYSAQLAATNGEHVMFCPLGTGTSTAVRYARLSRPRWPYANDKLKVCLSMRTSCGIHTESAFSFLSQIYAVVPNPENPGHPFHNADECGASTQHLRRRRLAGRLDHAPDYPVPNVLDYYGSGMDQIGVTSEYYRVLAKVHQYPLDVMAYRLVFATPSTRRDLIPAFKTADVNALFNGWITNFSQTDGASDDDLV